MTQDDQADGKLQVSRPSYAEFRQLHLLPNLPALLSPDYAASWPAFPSWSSSSYARDIATRYPSLIVPASCTLTGPILLSELLRRWEAGDARSEYLKDWHLPLIIEKLKRSVEKELYTVGDLWEDDWLNGWCRAETDDDYRFVYMGGDQTITPLHRDVFASYSISTNLRGCKKWTLFPPSCSSDLLHFIRTAGYDDKAVDVRKWDVATRKAFEKRGMLEFVQHEGETVFVPSGWYHQVQNLSQPTFSLNHNWTNSHCLLKLYETMSDAISASRAAIDDVRVLLGEDGERAFEEEVEKIVRADTGGSWQSFWRIVLWGLRDTLSAAVVEKKNRPPVQFVVDTVKPLIARFKAREEREIVWGAGLVELVKELEEALQVLEDVHPV